MKRVVAMSAGIGVMFAAVPSVCAQLDLQWREVKTPGPTARSEFAAAYDRARDRVVLHGGFNGMPSGQLSDTWEFDGAAWARIDTPPIGPLSGKMANHAMVYDEARGVCAMVAIPTQTHDWDGVNWTLEPIRYISPRYGYAMAYDPNHDAMYLHGGDGLLDCCRPLHDLWRKDGAGPWVRVSLDTVIPRRYLHAIAYDSGRDRLVVYGGEGEPPTLHLGDTWEWDGARWEQITVTSSPGPLYGHRMAYHEGLGAVVLLGGFTPTGLHSGTWRYDGIAWTNLGIADPPARGLHGLVYDSNRNRVVAFGGLSQLGRLDDTWVLASACRANCNGDTGPGGAPILDIQDFTCFQNAFSIGDLARADLGGVAGCSSDGQLSVADFTCFQNLFALGCP